MTKVLAVTLRGYGLVLVVLCLAFCARPVSDISAVIPSDSVRNYETTDPAPPWPPSSARSISAHPSLPSTWFPNTDLPQLTSSAPRFVLDARVVLCDHIYNLASKASAVNKALTDAFSHNSGRFSQLARSALSLIHPRPLPPPPPTQTSPPSTYIPLTRTTGADNPAPPTAAHIWRKRATSIEVNTGFERSSPWLHADVLDYLEPWVGHPDSVGWAYIALGVLALLVGLSITLKVLTSSNASASTIDIDDELEIHYTPSTRPRFAEWKELVGMEVELEVVFSFPDIPGGPVIYSSTGCFELEASSSLSMGELLDDIIALEESTLDPAYPYLHGATVEVRLEVAVAAYTVFYDRSGAEYVSGVNRERSGVCFSVSYLPYESQSTVPMYRSILNGDCGDVPDVQYLLTIQYFKFPLMRVVVDNSSICYGPLVIIPDEIFVILLFGAQRPTRSATQVRPPLLIEWVPQNSSPRSETQAPLAATVAPPPTVRIRPQRAARPGHSVYCPPRLQQAALTEERRLERARERQQVLEEAERELKVAEAAAEDPDKHKRGRRGGRQVRERAERRDFHALAATEYVRGE